MEPFPPLQTSHQYHYLGSRASRSSSSSRRRRKSSGLGADPRGDINAPAFSTLSDHSPPPTSPSPSSSAAPSRLPSSAEKAARGRKRRKVKSFFRRSRNLCIRHTWVVPLLLCLSVVSAYLVHPYPSNPASAFLFLSYPLPPHDLSKPIQYGKGARDFAFVAFYTAFLSFTREFLMQRLIRPMAIRAGIRSRAKQSRFMEQVYTAMYFAILGPFGLYVMSRTPVWYFNTRAMYEGFPHKTHEALFKGYYLLQASYWAQQMIVMLAGMERPRKDFKELVAHHIITLSLIWLSYRFHFTYMGLAVYITHDISDFFLATSKTLHYLDSSFVGPYFFLFIGVWTYLRHYINIRILISELPLPLPALSTWLNSIAAHYTNSPSFQPLPTSPIFPNWTAQWASVGPYELNWETQQYKCWIGQLISFSLLGSLQSVNLFWLFLILRIAWRFVTQSDLEDDRSEDGGESEQEAFVPGEEVYKAREESRNGNGSAEGKERENGAPTVLLNGQPVKEGAARRR